MGRCAEGIRCKKDCGGIGDYREVENRKIKIVKERKLTEG